VDRSTEAECDAPAGEFVGDVVGVGHRPGETVELGHHEGVAAAARRERLGEPGPRPGGAGETVVDVDALREHAEGGQGGALGGEVLRARRNAGVADQFGHS